MGSCFVLHDDGLAIFTGRVADHPLITLWGTKVVFGYLLVSEVGGKTLPPDTDCRYQVQAGAPWAQEQGISVTELPHEAQDLSHVLVHVVHKQKKKIKVWLRDTKIFQARMRGAPRQTPDLPAMVF